VLFNLHQEKDPPMSAKEVEIWGRPLSKMTAPELKEIAKAIEGVSGVHGMKKEELIEVLRKSKGIADTGAKKADASLRKLKNKIRTLKAGRAAAIEAQDRKRALICRRQISRLKKKMRRTAG
jgi:protein-arginine kinase activator protein McsA